jgi:hypothetical protein
MGVEPYRHAMGTSPLSWDEPNGFGKLTLRIDGHHAVCALEPNAKGDHELFSTLPLEGKRFTEEELVVTDEVPTDMKAAALALLRALKTP